VDNIKVDPGERGWSGVDWIVVAQDRSRCRILANVVMNLQVPRVTSGVVLRSIELVSFSKV
jgi:hypothetical protein